MGKNNHNKDVGSNVERSDDRIASTDEVFTPMEVCREMVNEISLDVLRNSRSTFIDNSAGHGNFLIALRDKLLEYHELPHILDNMLYAVEYMEDNHAELCERLGVSVDHPHYVRADALTYDYSFGESIGLDPFF